ncbi:MAG: hypothetical protein PHQ96_09460 [Candidatus Omnitrophica bacterium]|nr:hypothetical protein [Candidatus Omnitrophota bacterium]
MTKINFLDKFTSKGDVILKKVNAFAGLGEDYSDPFFLKGNSAIFYDCGCQTVFILRGVAFLKHEKPLTIAPGKRIDFSKLAAREIGWLLLDLAKVGGVGMIKVSQSSETVELAVAKSNKANGQLAAQLNSYLTNFFGFPCRRGRNICNKCACDAGLFVNY